MAIIDRIKYDSYLESVRDSIQLTHDIVEWRYDE